MAGDFLTQFYYYLYAGPAILTLVLLTLGDLSRRGLQQAGVNRHFAFITAILVITIEAVFCLSVSYRLSSVLALCGGVIVFMFFKFACRDNKTWFAFSMIPSTAIAFWLFGYGLWALQILALVYFLLPCKRFKVSNWLVFFPCIAIPLIIYIGKNYYYLLPYKTLSYPGCGKFQKPNFILEKNLAVGDEYYFGNYNKVEKIVEEADFQTEQMLFFYNLVKAQKGELPDNLLRFIPSQLGTFYTIGPKTNRLTIINMNELYWALGDMTLTERAAMMTNVFSPSNRNVRMIKRLAECNLVSKDTLAATKYLRILENTLAYRHWAIYAMNCKGMKYIRDKQAYINTADTIRLNDNLHMVMMELLDSNPDNTTALDYILCSTLLLKDMDNFKRDYDRYCIDTGKMRRKKLYQQALMIYLAGTNADEGEWAKYIYDEEELRKFKAYSNNRGNPRFSDTYWYYFDTAKTPTYEQ